MNQSRNVWPSTDSPLWLKTYSPGQQAGSVGGGPAGGREGSSESVWYVCVLGGAGWGLTTRVDGAAIALIVAVAIHWVERPTTRMLWRLLLILWPPC